VADNVYQDLIGITDTGRAADHLTEHRTRARVSICLGGESLTFAAAFEMLEPLQQEDQLSVTRRVLERMRNRPECIIGGVPMRATKGIPMGDYLYQQEALLTSNDPELSAAIRHDKAIEILPRGFKFINDKDLPGERKRSALRAASASADGTTSARLRT
jgi:hypothetical protein